MLTATIIPVAVLALLLGLRVLPESTAPERIRLDVVGAILAAAFLIGLCALRWPRARASP